MFQFLALTTLSYKSPFLQNVDALVCAIHPNTATNANSCLLLNHNVHHSWVTELQFPIWLNVIWWCCIEWIYNSRLTEELLATSEELKNMIHWYCGKEVEIKVKPRGNLDLNIWQICQIETEGWQKPTVGCWTGGWEEVGGGWALPPDPPPPSSPTTEITFAKTKKSP